MTYEGPYDIKAEGWAVITPEGRRVGVVHDNGYPGAIDRGGRYFATANTRIDVVGDRADTFDEALRFILASADIS